MERKIRANSSIERRHAPGLLWSSIEGTPAPGLLCKEDLQQVFYGMKTSTRSSMERRSPPGLLWRDDQDQGF